MLLFCGTYTSGKVFPSPLLLKNDKPGVFNHFCLVYLFLDEKKFNLPPSSCWTTTFCESCSDLQKKRKGFQSAKPQIFTLPEVIFLKFCELSTNFRRFGTRGGVEDTRLEAKAKDTKKIRAQGQGQGQPFRGQTLSRPRTGMLEAKAKDQGHKAQVLPKKKKKKKVFTKIFQAISKKKKKKKKVFTKIFQAISTKKRFPKNFSTAPQNFNFPKNSAVLEPRTGQFSRT